MVALVCAWMDVSHGDLPMQKELVCIGVDQRVIAVTCMYVIAIGASVIAAAAPIDPHSP